MSDWADILSGNTKQNELRSLHIWAQTSQHERERLSFQKYQNEWQTDSHCLSYSVCVTYFWNIFSFSVCLTYFWNIVSLSLIFWLCHLFFKHILIVSPILFVSPIFDEEKPSTQYWLWVGHTNSYFILGVD